MRRPEPRARCPCFQSRVDWHGEKLIQCGGHIYRFIVGAERESQYRTRCCGDYQRCRLYRERKDEDDDAGREQGHRGAEPRGL